MNAAVSRNRLLKLADFLSDLPRKRFNYSHIIDEYQWEGKTDLSCGTTACALGWAGAMPEFRKAGLKIERGEKFGWVSTPDKGYNANVVFTDKDGERFNNFDAAEQFFGLTEEESFFLFNPEEEYNGQVAPGETATAKQVARHIRRFVEKYRS